MNSQELRIGNWVYLPSKKKQYQISSGHDIEEIEDSNDAEPIEITHDRLIMLGFKCTAYQFRYETDKYMIEQWVSSGQYFFRVRVSETDSIAIAELDYLHQLQNLYFALTGEELTSSSRTMEGHVHLD